jgi:hypothetical protein
MEWVLIFQLLSGETAELPATRAECQSTIELAAARGGVVVNIRGRERQIIRAWDVACVEVAGKQQETQVR